jgi:hypothetical protein
MVLGYCLAHHIVASFSVVLADFPVVIKQTDMRNTRQIRKILKQSCQKMVGGTLGVEWRSSNGKVWPAGPQPMALPCDSNASCLVSSTGRLCGVAGSRYPPTESDSVLSIHECMRNPARKSPESRSQDVLSFVMEMKLYEVIPVLAFVLSPGI